MSTLDAGLEKIGRAICVRMGIEPDSNVSVIRGEYFPIWKVYLYDARRVLLGYQRMPGRDAPSPRPYNHVVHKIAGSVNNEAVTREINQA